MRTIYLGEAYRHHNGQATRFERHYDDGERHGDDMPVFERGATGGRGEYERPERYEDRVTMRRLKPWRRY